MSSTAARAGQIVVDDEVEAPADLVGRSRIFVMSDNMIVGIIELLCQLELWLVQTGPDDFANVIVEAPCKAGIPYPDVQDPFRAEIELIDIALRPQLIRSRPLSRPVP
jgi:hypothetical protein